MIACGDADAMVTGLTKSYYDTIDDISIGSEIIFNTFQSTSCRLSMSYNWLQTDVCYIMRTNFDNKQNQNAIFSIVESRYAHEMEILYGFGNKFVVIDKFLTYEVNNDILNNLNLDPTTDHKVLFEQANNILNNIGKEKKMPVIDANGSYLNDPISKTYSSQIVAFQSFLNNNPLGNGIGVSKSMPNIFYDEYNKDKQLNIIE